MSEQQPIVADKSWFSPKHWLIAFAVLMLLGIAIWRLPLLDWSDQLDVWITEHFVAGLLLYIVSIFVWSLFIPTAVPILLAGYFFGFWLGVAATYISTTLSFMFAFMSTRYFFRDHAARYLSKRPKFKSFIDHLEESGWRLVIWMRLSPIVPFHIQNYCYGASGMSLKTCLWATCLGKLPAVIVTVLMGSIAKQSQIGLRGLSEIERPWWWYVFLVLAAIAAVAVTYLIIRAGRTALKREHIDDVEA